jgi:hypothetical protein
MRSLKPTVSKRKLSIRATAGHSRKLRNRIREQDREGLVYLHVNIVSHLDDGVVDLTEGDE